ncbi:unnamed protein product [Anisakis simplex]|uniref:Uncharacterized protein n=1 Tax=Anisakis simplex TaxID=6269 RepID=A0A3P6RXI3_ANISI|nr:unnamed protein product [Anisakis simplex]
MECFDRNNGDETKCREERKRFDRDCPASWVSHFTSLMRVSFRKLRSNFFYN